MNPSITFSPLLPVHLSQVHDWLQKAHVLSFRDDGDRTLSQVINHYGPEEGLSRYLVLINEQPAGYLQTYEINANSDFCDFILLNKKNIGIDFFIGNEAFLNKGFALRILATFIANYCEDVDRIIVDPQAENTKAIHIYEKSGFTRVGGHTAKGKQFELYAINLR